MISRKRLLATLAVLLALSSPMAAHAGENRKIKVAWRPVEKAVKYDFQLSASAEMDPLIERKEYGEPEVTLSLKPGTYYFRVRGIDQGEAPGPWSEVQGFVVNPAAPKQLSPKEGEEFKSKAVAKEGIHLKWEKGISGTQYLIQIKDKQGKLFKRNVDGNEFHWTPTEAGEYQWRIGFETPSGDEWGKYRSLKIAEEAFAPEKPPEPPAPPKQVVVVKEVKYIDFEGTLQAPEEEPAETTEAGKDRKAASVAPGAQAQADAAKPTAETHADAEEKLGPTRPPEWWLIGRLAESVVAYNATDKDSGVNGSGAAVVGLVSAELRWRGTKKADQIWTLSAAANFEMIRQIVLGTTFNLPRGYARAFYGRELGPWRLAPFVQVNGGESGVFVVQSATKAINATVMREGAGIGGAATYRAAPGVLLSALGLIRMDFGGSSPSLPNPLLTTSSFEVGFGAGIVLTPRIMIEGRLRALQETFAWQPTKAQADGSSSSLNNVFLIIDGGLGFRF